MIYPQQDYLNFESIKLLRMQDNQHGDLPFFARIYDQTGITQEIHKHEYSQINYIYAGNCQHRIGYMTHAAREGDVLVIPPFMPHRLIAETDSPVKIIEIEFNIELITHELSFVITNSLLLDFLLLEPYLASSKQIVMPQLSLTGSLRIQMESLMLTIVKEFQDQLDNYKLIVKSLIMILLVQLSRTRQNSFRSDSTNTTLKIHRESINKAIAHIQQYYQEKLSLKNVAQISMLSTSYFCVVFKSITHRTFIEYINDLRIEKSMELLCTTSKSVGEICFEVGFNNISYYDHLFKKYTSLSPSAFRKSPTIKRDR